jgi:hypothetical protein
LKPLCLLALVALSGCIGNAYAGDFLVPNTQDGGCYVVGDDAGTTALAPVPPDSQIMVTTTAAVTYRQCIPFNGLDGGPPCFATPTDAPIPVTTAGIDLCVKSGYPLMSFLKGSTNATVCVYKVVPKTVCQINSP